MLDGVYHMDEGTEALPCGANDESRNMNNLYSIYFIIEDAKVIVIDSGNPSGGEVETNAKIIHGCPA